MAFEATALRVLVASPSDTQAERQSITQAIVEWNDRNAEGIGVVLVPALWEISASPELGAAPQSIINRQLVDRTDVLVGTFWTRLGTPTDDGLSGTTEEIERLLDRGGRALVYFSNQPTAPDTVDPGQLAALIAYKQDLFRRGICGSYETVDELSRKLQNDLRSTVENMIESGALSTRGLPSGSSRALRDADFIASELRRLGATSASSYKVAVGHHQSNDLQLLMGTVREELVRLHGSLAALSSSAAEGELGTALVKLAEEAAEAERVQIFMDGGRSWRELVSRASSVLEEIQRLARAEWTIDPSGEGG